jgi:hypothetical protein
MGSTEPEMWTVMFGCVSTIGAVVTEASCSLSAVDIVNGRDGTVKLSVAGAGFTTVAEAVMVSGGEDTLKMRLSKEGNGPPPNGTIHLISLVVE